MATRVIKNQEVVEEDFTWQVFEAGQDAPEEGSSVLVPLTYALEHGLDQFDASSLARLGLILTGDDNPSEAKQFFERIDCIAVSFPKFADGRGYSIGRLLRERFGWQGELRAVGQILHDQLLYLSRCGFDVLELEEGKDPERALKAFKVFSVNYQPAVDSDQAIYHRR